MMISFIVLAVLLVFSALGVIVSRNAIFSALSLIGNLLCVAGIFAMLDAHFLAVAQIVVYAGAIMVLFVFVIMLLNIKIEQPKKSGKISAFLAWLGCFVFIALLAQIFWRIFANAPSEHPNGIQGTVKAVGALLYTEYVFAFEAASLLIIAAIVGAVMLAKRKIPDTTGRA